MYKKITSRTAREIGLIVGEKNMLAERERMEGYSHDEFALRSLARYPEIVAMPGETRQVSELVKLASRERFPVVARGGGTGLCGGCVPLFGGLVLSLERMNRVLDVDTENHMAELEAGVSLDAFYGAIGKQGMFFPPHPGEESATIGGVIATNAGGSRALKYGTIRNFLRGLQAVLPDGRITALGGRTLKDSSGYSLLHLIAGSEGTLGVITSATLGIMPEPASTLTLIVPFDDMFDVFKAVPRMLGAGILPLAVEFVSREVISVAEEHLDRKWPAGKGDFFLMIILEGQEEELLSAAERISVICLEHGSLDVLVASGREKQQEILATRSLVYEALKAKTLEILDIALPRNRMEGHLRRVAELSRQHDVWLPTYGHAADGNLHTHIMRTDREGKDLADWEAVYPVVRDAIHADARKRGGRVSGEHGIGLAKKEYLGMFTDEISLGLMKGIKKVFDPGNILNPGKIF